MAPPFRYRLTDTEKDALLRDQAALIEAQAAKIAELEAALFQPKKTSRNSSNPPSTDFKGGGSRGDGAGKKKPRKRRDGPGVSRRLAEFPDETVQVTATACDKCGADVSGQHQSVRHRYDHIDIPPVAPHTIRVELLGGRCRCCKARFKAPAPEGMPPGTPFGPNIRAYLLYLHHSHHVGFERLQRLMLEMFGLSISEGAIANSFERQTGPLEAEREAIRAKLRMAEVIASDETTTRIKRASDLLCMIDPVHASEKGSMHDDIQGNAGRIAEGLRAA